ncbi:DUF3592 domain-containing protein [Paenacidovorax monticola]|uniref:DUF3592 domain-containing protein n=1 Tax=Paenacidovorax monticola TaxID=1926868 RepID=A0A7H0HI97_9BURK|nr:DUF3592 domain-containing protein [Paenacidovorax monticola]
MANDPFSVRLGRWLMSLFALPFVAVGVGMLVLSVLPTLYDWARMRSWQPVEATLVSAALTEQRGRKSTTFNVTADYRYSVAGREYEARRVAIGGSGDNVGDFQELLGRRLEAAWREGGPCRPGPTPPAHRRPCWTAACAPGCWRSRRCSRCCSAALARACWCCCGVAGRPSPCPMQGAPSPGKPGANGPRAPLRRASRWSFGCWEALPWSGT